MVSLKEIQASNSLITNTTVPHVSIFVGGTSGIGKSTIRALAATNTTTKIYIVGRKSSTPQTQEFISSLSALHPTVQLIHLECEYSLLSETARVCHLLKSQEQHIDLLFLTAGYAPFGSRQDTTEGLELAGSLEYYSRILFIRHLLPLLSSSSSSSSTNPPARVISVLGGGLERINSVNLDDLHLRSPGAFNGINAQMQYVTMNTLALETMADENREVTFIHSWPGWVKTGNVRRGRDPGSFVYWVIEWVLEPLLGLFSYAEEEAGQRYLFQCTSAGFGGSGVEWSGGKGVNSRGKGEGEGEGSGGGGLFLVNYKCECMSNTKVLERLREEAKGKVWEHTLEVLRPYM